MKHHQNRIKFFIEAFTKLSKKLNKNEIGSFDMFTDHEEIE